MSFETGNFYRHLFVLLVVALVSSCTTPPRPFDSSEWKRGDATTRGGMFEDLINRKLLIGKSRVDVEALLGKPDYQDADGYDYKVITVARCRYVWECRLGVVVDRKSGLVAFVAVND
jgi:hypothetical protein